MGDLSTLKAGIESLKARVLGKEKKLEEAEVSYESVPIVDRVKTESESIAVDVEKKDDKPEEAVLEVSRTNSYVDVENNDIQSEESASNNKAVVEISENVEAQEKSVDKTAEAG